MATLATLWRCSMLGQPCCSSWRFWVGTSGMHCSCYQWTFQSDYLWVIFPRSSRVPQTGKSRKVRDLKLEWIKSSSCLERQPRKIANENWIWREWCLISLRPLHFECSVQGKDLLCALTWKIWSWVAISSHILPYLAISKVVVMSEIQNVHSCCKIFM